jgi:biopolymer transport protein ExbB/TolQ
MAMKSFNTKLINLAIAVGAAFLITMLLVLGENLTRPKTESRIVQVPISTTGTATKPQIEYYSESESSMHRLFVMFGGKLPDGFIQCFTYFLFIYGLLDIRLKRQEIENENRMFNRELLPVDDNQILTLSDIEKLRETTAKLEGRTPSVLGSLIRRASTAYLANRSPSETLNLVSTQVRISQADNESEHALVRYVAWAVPSVGFIGTVIGIAAALNIAYKTANDENAIKEVTDLLGIAFDTTLVALLLDTVFVYYVHDLQERSEKLFAKMESYLIEHFISRVSQKA